jgi:N-acetylmuramoyl-L-alanine amidase
MRYSILSLVLILILLPTVLFPLSVQFRSFDHPGYTRVVLQSDQPLVYKFRSGEQVIVVDIKGHINETPKTLPIAKSSLLESLSTSRVDGQTRFEIRLRRHAQVKSHFVLEKPHRLVFDLVMGAAPRAQAPSTPAAPGLTKPLDPPQPPQETKPALQPEEKPNEVSAAAEAEPEKLPPLALRRIETICIDPGHGGSDLGAVGGNGRIYEKDIVLNIARHLKGMVMRHLGLRVIMTREGDDEVSLNSRVAKANNEKAQLFVSIHLNADYRKSARGPETFYVSLKATDKEAAELAKKENASYDEIEQVAENDDLKMILWNMAQNEYIQESSLLAVDIQEELNELLNTRNRGVKQAPFRVLMRAAMPAVLVEIAFLSNPSEAQKAVSESFQLEAAQAVFRGINRFVSRYNSTVGE